MNKYLFPANDVLRRESWFSLVLTILSKIENQKLGNKKLFYIKYIYQLYFLLLILTR